MSQAVLIRLGLTRTTHLAATEYVVGKNEGWKPDSELINWPNGTSKLDFKAGDLNYL